MRVEEKISLLENIPLFSGLGEEELVTLFDHSAIRTFPKHTVIIHEGDESGSLYIIISGKVKVYLTNDKGKEVILTMQGPDTYLGEMALLDVQRRSASVMTLVDTKCIVITRADFMRCISMHPEIALRVMRDLIHRLRDLTEDVKGLALLDVYGRVSRALVKLAHEKEGEMIVGQPFSRKDLANMVGSSREMVTRILKDLEEGGYIEKRGRAIAISKKLPTAW